MDYYSYDTVTTTGGSEGLLAGVGTGMILFYVVFIAFIVIGMWKVFAKAGKPGWAALVPIYNTIVMLKIVCRPVWWILPMFIPFVNIIFFVIVSNDLAKSFGKGVGWTLGLIFLSFIFWPMLGFGSAKYHGPSAGK